MSSKRIFAMVLRYFYNMRHNLDRLSDMFYWPAMELFIWGITGLYLGQIANNSSNYLFIILTGLVFWVVIWRTNFEVTTNLLAEIWDRNVVNLFTTPLTVFEWMSAFIISGFIKTIISLSFSALLAFIFYKYNIFRFGPFLLLYVTSLMITGWTGGFIFGGLLIRYGQRLQTLAWTGIALIAPFSAVYYPLSALPSWAQKIGLFIPSTYVFETIRQQLFTGSVSYDKIIINFGLNIIYFSLSIWFFILMFNKSRKMGLGRLI